MNYLIAFRKVDELLKVKFLGVCYTNSVSLALVISVFVLLLSPCLYAA